MAANRRYEWHARTKEVEREFVAARKAADDLLDALRRGTTELPVDVDYRDVRRMSDSLEGTYLIRLYAAFESGLRSYWATIRDTAPPSRDLIDAVDARRRVPDDLRQEVHGVRAYRNSLVHEGDDEPDPLSLGDARSRLQRFFSRLPEDW